MTPAFGKNSQLNCLGIALKNTKRCELNNGLKSTLMAMDMCLWLRLTKEWEMWYAYLKFLIPNLLLWERIKQLRIKEMLNQSTVKTTLKKANIGISYCTWDSTTNTGWHFQELIKTMTDAWPKMNSQRLCRLWNDGVLMLAMEIIYGAKLTKMVMAWFYLLNLLISPSKNNWT